jgi:glycosyltransferase involved in cell wall biosynthesis
MKIGVDARDILRREVGITVFTKGILAGLAESGVSGEIILYLDDFGDESAVLQAGSFMGLETRVVPGRGAKWKHIGLPAALRRDRTDLFHSMTSTLPVYVPGRKIVTFCDVFQETHPEFVPAKTRVLMNRLYKSAARRADRIIAISENTKDDIVTYYGVPEHKITVIYPGLNENCRPIGSKDAATATKKYGIDGPYVLHVGALAEWRNITRLIEAYRIAVQTVPGLKLVLVGRPVWGYDLAAAAGPDLGKNIISIPFVPNEDLVALYNEAQALAMPSLAEGFGLPVIEAMACGTAVVTSNISALPEAAGGAALLVDPFDTPEIANAIIRAITDSKLKNNLIEKGYKQASKFTWRGAGEATAAVYKSFA